MLRGQLDGTYIADQTFGQGLSFWRNKSLSFFEHFFSKSHI